MTPKEKKEILKSYSYLIFTLKSLKNEFDTLQLAIISPSISKISSMPKSNNFLQDKICENVSLLIEQEEKYIKKQKEILEQLEKINIAIENLDNNIYQELLTLRYKQKNSWQQIAKKMGYHVDNCFKIHGHALKNINFL